MTAVGPLTLVDVYAAKRRLSGRLPPSPLLHSSWLSSLTGAEVHLKIESLQPSGSFKIRGALNSALNAVTSAGTPTIVTASAGNHGRAMAIAAEQLGLRAIVFTPATAPLVKKRAIERHGAELRDHLRDFDAADAAARQLATDEGWLFISSYNHRDVIAGAGTIALECLDRLPAVDRLVVPLGGGGLASGMALALKGAAPGVQIVGVEVEASTQFSTSLTAGHITEVAVRPSLADGLTGNLEAGAITFDLVRRYVDRVVTVSERQLETAMRGLASEEHLIADGAGATATAAVLAGHAITAGQRAVVMVTGGNIDLDRFVPVVS